MDKAGKLTLKTTISNIKDNINQLDITLSTLDMLINQQKSFIKRCQDEGKSEDVYEKEIAILDILNDNFYVLSENKENLTHAYDSLKEIKYS